MNVRNNVIVDINETNIKQTATIASKSRISVDRLRFWSKNDTYD